VLLASAALVFLVANLVLAGAAVARSIDRGRAARTETENVRRLRGCEHFDVLADDGRIGIVDEVIATRDGTNEILVVGDGWFGARRFYVLADDVASADEKNRILRLKSPVREPARAG
jgi:hypothetical protein